MLSATTPTLSPRRADTAPALATPRSSQSARALAGMLLAAMVSALVVTADALIDIYADGHLLLAWTCLWAVGFAAMALCADAARAGARRLLAHAGGWQARREARASDRAWLALARHDPRVMAELQGAIERARLEREEVLLAYGRAWVSHRPVGTLNAAYTGSRVPFKASPVTGLPMHLRYLQG